MNTSRKGYPCSVPMEGTHTSTSLSSRQAIRATAANIPPELFWNILRYVIEFHEDNNLPNGDLCGQMNCSLVCVYWAQEIRRSLYDKRIVWIRNEKHAKGLRKLVVHRGSERLTPIVDMIAHINVIHDVKSRSWHHILMCLIPAIPPHKFRKLAIYSNFPTSSPQSSHWGVPKRLPSFTTPYSSLHLSNVRFPSLHALVSLLRQFPRLEELDLALLRWDDEDMNAPAHALPSTTPQLERNCNRPLWSTIKLRECACGDNTLLFLHLAQLRPYGHSLLKTLSNNDQDAVAEIINVFSLGGAKDGHWINFTVAALSGK